MLIYSTCPGCNGTLIVSEPGQRCHDGCQSRSTQAEYLAQEWLAAELAGDDAEADRLEEQITTLDNRPPRFTEAAGLYASWGWPVFPLKPACGPDGCHKCHGETPCGKRPASRHGFKDATTDADRLFAWWSRHPDCNVGLATGHRFDVIDIDGLGGNQHAIAGAWALAELLAVGDDHVNARGVHDGRGPIPDCHGQVATTSGGLHLYIRPSGGGNGAKWRPGVDFRGLGGYVVAPPSTLGAHNRAWSWISKPSPTLKTAGARG